MKVILLKDIPKLGHKYDVKEVASGHALNFLVPNRMVEVATPASIKKIEALKAQTLAEKKIQEDLLIKSLKTIDGTTIELTEKANEKGHLFASIHKNEIIKEIGKKTNFGILPEFLIMEKPIKEVGEYPLTVKVGDKSAGIKIIVKAK